MHAEYVHLLFLWEKYVAAAAFSPSLCLESRWLSVEDASFQGFIIIFFKLAFHLMTFGFEKENWSKDINKHIHKRKFDEHT